MRGYSEAIEALNSLQSNAAVIESIRKSGGKGGEAQLVETVDYLERIGYRPHDLDRLNVLHITGTKGKGSTSAFTSSLLQHAAPAAKVGLYTSPHMVAVRERIRINGHPIPEAMFARYFWDVWDKLGQNAPMEGTPLRPAYFRYMTLLAFHVFLSERVDATVLEVGVGGTYDSTNIVPAPIVTGVTSLGIDHIFVLGRTLPEIAHQKGGIYKPGVPAFAVDQPEGLDVLRARAQELKASSFTIVPVHPALSTIKLGLAGAHQRINASLALAMVKAFFESPRKPQAFASAPPLTDPIPATYKEALEQAKWPGRCQVVRAPTDAERTYFLDGAHTVESLRVCAEWFANEVLAPRLANENERRESALVFNCTSGRSARDLLASLLDTLVRSKRIDRPFDTVVFCTNTTFADGHSAGDLTSKAVDEKDLEALTVQHELAMAWRELTSGSTAEFASAACPVTVAPSIEHALDAIADQHDVLVTGSLHLVGGVMAVANLPVS